MEFILKQYRYKLNEKIQDGCQNIKFLQKILPKSNKNLELRYVCVSKRYYKYGYLNMNIFYLKFLVILINQIF